MPVYLHPPLGATPPPGKKGEKVLGGPLLECYKPWRLHQHWAPGMPQSAPRTPNRQARSRSTVKHTFAVCIGIRECLSPAATLYRHPCPSFWRRPEFPLARPFLRGCEAARTLAEFAFEFGGKVASWPVRARCVGRHGRRDLTGHDLTRPREVQVSNCSKPQDEHPQGAQGDDSLRRKSCVVKQYAAGQRRGRKKGGGE